jgi:hypothetical protein
MKFADCRKAFSTLIRDSGCFNAIKRFLLSVIAWAFGNTGIKKAAGIFDITIKGSNINFNNFLEGNAKIYRPLASPKPNEKIQVWSSTSRCPTDDEANIPFGSSGVNFAIDENGYAHFGSGDETIGKSDIFYNITDSNGICSTICVAGGKVYNVSRDDNGKILNTPDANSCGESEIKLTSLKDQNETFSCHCSAMNGGMTIRCANNQQIYPITNPNISIPTVSSANPNFPNQSPSEYGGSFNRLQQQFSPPLANPSVSQLTNYDTRTKAFDPKLFPAANGHCSHPTVYQPLAKGMECEVSAYTMQHNDANAVFFNLGKSASFTIDQNGCVTVSKKRGQKAYDGYYNVTNRKTNICAKIAVLNGKAYNVLYGSDGIISGNVTTVQNVHSGLVFTCHVKDNKWTLLDNRSQMHASGTMGGLLPAKRKQSGSQPSSQPLSSVAYRSVDFNDFPGGKSNSNSKRVYQPLSFDLLKSGVSSVINTISMKFTNYKLVKINAFGPDVKIDGNGKITKHNKSNILIKNGFYNIFILPNICSTIAVCDCCVYNVPRDPNSGTILYDSSKSIIPLTALDGNVSAVCYDINQKMFRENIPQQNFNSHQNFNQPQNIPQQNFNQSQNIPQQNFIQPQNIPQQNFTQPQDIPQQTFTQPQNIPQQNFIQPQNIPHQNFTQPQNIPQQNFIQPQTIPHQNFTQPQNIPHQNFTQPQNIPPS